MKIFKKDEKLKPIKLVTVHKFKIKITLINDTKFEYLTEWINLNKYSEGIESYINEKLSNSQLKIKDKIIMVDKILHVKYELYDIGTIDYTLSNNEEIDYYFLYDDQWVFKHDL